MCNTFSFGDSSQRLTIHVFQNVRNVIAMNLFQNVVTIQSPQMKNPEETTTVKYSKATILHVG